MRENPIILGIETSCDETSAAVLRGDELLSNVISSQIEIHRRFGGVVPEIASRNHLTAILPVIDEALDKAGVCKTDLDAIGVTYGAGLVGALLVGVSAAKALAYALNIPLYAVNHIEAHIAANYLSYPQLQPPFLAVVASGGHTGVARVDGRNDFTMISSTTDDAIGEAFDKVARALGLPYPGGPEIDRLARTGEANIEFMERKRGKAAELSYSGLKTAVVNYLHNLEQKGEKPNLPDVCASFLKDGGGHARRSRRASGQSDGHNDGCRRGRRFGKFVFARTAKSRRRKAGVHGVFSAYVVVHGQCGNGSRARARHDGGGR